MEITKKNRRNVMSAGALVIIASMYANLLLSAFAVREPYVEMIKIALLVIATMVLKNWKFGLVLMTITFTRLLNHYAMELPFFNDWFDSTTFTGNYGSSIVLKTIAALLVAGVLRFLYRKKDQNYLRWGDLNRKAKKIGWLGIEENRITWKKLSVVSGVLISFGTILLTFITVLGRLNALKFDFFLLKFPYIILFALINSLCEGILFRNAILGPLHSIVEKKEVVLLSALFFGSFHYYGAPGGIVGVIMSTMLGWFLARSMVETKGLFAPWIIHFMQDFVIFATIALLGDFIA